MTNFFFEFFMRSSQRMPLYLFYTMVQKSQNGQKLKSRGTVLNCQPGTLSNDVGILQKFKDHAKVSDSIKKNPGCRFCTA